MRLQFGWVVGVAAAWMCSAPAGAREVSEALKLVPQDAAAFALVNKVGETLQRIEDIGKKWSSLPVSFRELIRKEVGIEKGVDEKGDLVVVIYSIGNEKDQASVYCVPITDYKEFLQSLKPGEAKDGSARSPGPTVRSC